LLLLISLLKKDFAAIGACVRPFLPSQVISRVGHFTWTIARRGARQDRTGQDTTVQDMKRGWTLIYLEI
jgi:hypothetical protein